MIITDNTKYADFAPFEEVITQASIQDIKGAAERKFKNCYELTIDEFFGVCGGDYSLLGDLTEPTVLQVYWLKRFADFGDELAKACERLKIEPTPEQAQANNGCVPMTAQESMLCFTREYFGLPSFYAAGERTMGEYLTARKDKYNEARQRRNFEEIQKRKLHTKR